MVEWKSFEVRSNSLLFCCSMKIKRIAQIIYQSRKSCRELKSQKCCIKVLLFRDSWVLWDAAGWSWSLGFLPGLVGPGWRQPWWFGNPRLSCVVQDADAVVFVMHFVCSAHSHTQSSALQQTRRHQQQQQANHTVWPLVQQGQGVYNLLKYKKRNYK